MDCPRLHGDVCLLRDQRDGPIIHRGAGKRDSETIVTGTHQSNIRAGGKNNSILCDFCHSVFSVVSVRSPAVRDVLGAGTDLSDPGDSLHFAGSNITGASVGHRSAYGSAGIVVRYHVDLAAQQHERVLLSARHVSANNEASEPVHPSWVGTEGV